MSLAAQHERLTAYCTAHGLELVGVEQDAGVSGKVAPAQRPGLARALEAVRRGDAHGVVVLRLDRLSRSTRDVLDLVDETRQGSWRLVSVSEHLDTGSAAGRLVVTVLAALSEMEREQVAERTRFALDAIAREGRGRSRPTSRVQALEVERGRDAARSQALLAEPQESAKRVLLARVGHQLSTIAGRILGPAVGGTPAEGRESASLDPGERGRERAETIMGHTGHRSAAMERAGTWVPRPSALEGGRRARASAVTRGPAAMRAPVARGGSGEDGCHESFRERRVAATNETYAIEAWHER